MFNQEFFILAIPNLVELFTELCLIGIFTKSPIRNNIIKILFSSFILIFIFELISPCLPRYILPFTTNLIICITTLLIYHSSLLKTLFANILVSLILFILDFVLTMILLTFNYNNLSNPSLIVSFTSNLSFTILLVVTTFYIYYKRSTLTYNKLFPTANAFSLFANLVVSFLLIIPNALIIVIYYEQQTLPIAITFINIAAIILSFFLSIYNTSKNTSHIRAEQELEFQRNYTSTLETLVDNLRTFKHDFDNTLQLLYGYIEIGSIDGLKKTFHQVLDESKTISSLSKLNPDKIKNPHLYGLLSSKNNLAIENNISLNIDINGNIENIDMKIFDFSRILGIFLDNAIEATLDAKYKKICFTMKEKNNCIEILIQNTYNQLALSTTEMFDKGNSSKGENRGLGLYEVKKLLSKYKNSNLETYIEDCYFCQKLTIPLVRETISV